MEFCGWFENSMRSWTLSQNSWHPFSPWVLLVHTCWQGASGGSLSPNDVLSSEVSAPDLNVDGSHSCNPMPGVCLFHNWFLNTIKYFGKHESCSIPTILSLAREWECFWKARLCSKIQDALPKLNFLQQTSYLPTTRTSIFLSSLLPSLSFLSHLFLYLFISSLIYTFWYIWRPV